MQTYRYLATRFTLSDNLHSFPLVSFLNSLFVDTIENILSAPPPLSLSPHVVDARVHIKSLGILQTEGSLRSPYDGWSISRELTLIRVCYCSIYARIDEEQLVYCKSLHSVLLQTIKRSVKRPCKINSIFMGWRVCVVGIGTAVAALNAWQLDQMVVNHLKRDCLQGFSVLPTRHRFTNVSYRNSERERKRCRLHFCVGIAPIKAFADQSQWWSYSREIVETINPR